MYVRENAVCIRKNMYRERQIPFDFTDKWNLRNKTHINKSRTVTKEKKVVVASGAVGGSMGKMGEVEWKWRLPIMESISHGG